MVHATPPTPEEPSSTIDVGEVRRAQDLLRQFDQAARRGPVVYVARGAEGVLYIGVSERLADRLRHHKHKAWWPLVTSIDIHRCRSRREAEDREAELIAELAPPNNVAPGSGRHMIAAGMLSRRGPAL